MAAQRGDRTVEASSHPRLLSLLVNTPGGQLGDIYPVHCQIFSADPSFYLHLAAWYFDCGDVADHKAMFIVCLVLGEEPAHREVGLALVRRLRPEQLVRVLDFIHGHTVTRRLVVYARTSGRRRLSIKARPNLIGRLARFLGSGPVRRQVPAEATAPLPTRISESQGLFRNLPRSLRTEIAGYLRRHEADTDWFDATVCVARKALKRLYALNHVKPGARAQRVLFDNDPPADSRLCALRQLARAAAPADQTKAIMTHAIPYAQAASVLRQMTPTVLLTLIEEMSPQDVFANIASLTERGAMDNAYLKARIERKLALSDKAGPCGDAGGSHSVGQRGVDVLGTILGYPLPQRR